MRHLSLPGIIFLITLLGVVRPEGKATDNNTLFSSKECSDDIQKYCQNILGNGMTDVAVLRCLNYRMESLSELNSECQHLMFNVKKTLTENFKNDVLFKRICQIELEKFTECNTGNTSVSSCLIAHDQEIESAACRKLINKVKPLIFSDYRLIENFQVDCQDEIEKYKCGRVNGKEKEFSPQGKIIECLTSNFKKFLLNKKCMKQILRITELQSEDFHLDRPLFFACREDRERFCESTVSGEGRVYKCLNLNKFKQEFSMACRNQLTRRQIINFEIAETNKVFLQNCQKNIKETNCFRPNLASKNEYIALSAVMLCLESAEKDRFSLESKCKADLIDHRKMLMEDYQLSPNIVTSCEEEINKLCNGGIERNSKTLHCLFGAMMKASSDINLKNSVSQRCSSEIGLFMKLVNPAENINLDPSLSKACQNLLIDGPCKNLQSDHGSMVECLTRQLGSLEMSDECTERLLEIQFFVVRDWTLNSEFYKNCHADAVNFCQAPNEWYSPKNVTQLGKGMVLPCLYHHMSESDAEIGSEYYISNNCAIQVRSVMLKRAKSIELMPSIQESCGYDLARLCSNKKVSQKGEELQCLQSNYKILDATCVSSLNYVIKTQNKDIRLDQILYKSCLPTIEKYCEEKREEKGELLECLIKQKNNQDMQHMCRVGIEHHQILNLNDISFNFKLVKNCKYEMSEHCSQKKTKMDVVYCLSELILNDTLLNENQRVTNKCRRQLKFEMLQTNENIKLNPKLAEVCSNDIQMLCSNIEYGKGGIIECLRTNQARLSNQCKFKIFKLAKIGLVEEGSDYSLKHKCKYAIEKFCHIDSSISTIDCLRKHLLKQSLGHECREVVINRIIVENRDVRLNKNLYKTCLPDISRLCSRHFTDANAQSNLNGNTLECLKKNLVRKRLSKYCHIEVSSVMREAANVDFRLDPLLAEGCIDELELLCKDESNENKENCLRLKFQQMRIPKESQCYEEVKRIIIEGAADLFVDHELSQVCEYDLGNFCGNVPPGSANHLRCLMDAKEVSTNKLSENCAEMLESRRELWKLAKIDKEIMSLNDLANIINESHSRGYLLAALFLILCIVFVSGATCRPILLKKQWNKVK